MTISQSSISTPALRIPGSVAIVGSRGFSDLGAVRAYVDALPEGSVVVTGGARGVDITAEDAARKRGLRVATFLPDWQRYGPRGAPLERNKLIAASVDRMVAFWDGKSTGTMHAVTQARKLGKPVEIRTAR